MTKGQAEWIAAMKKEMEQKALQEQRALAAKEEILSHIIKIREIAQYCSEVGFLFISIEKDLVHFHNDWREKTCIIPISYTKRLNKINTKEITI